MALFKSIATFALRNVVEGTVIAMGGEFAASICEQVGGRVGGSFRDPSRVVLNALEKASQQALDTVQSALAGSGLLDKLDAGEVKGLRAELETLLEARTAVRAFERGTAHSSIGRPRGAAPTNAGRDATHAFPAQ